MGQQEAQQQANQIRVFGENVKVKRTFDVMAEH